MPIKYGSRAVNDIFYGNKRVLQMYYGSNLVYNADMGVPSDYLELEYIQSSGREWIDTEITPQANILRTVTKCQDTGDTLGGSYFGAVTDPAPRNGFRIYNHSQDGTACLQTVTVVTLPTSLNDILDLDITINHGESLSCLCNGTLYTKTDSTINLTNTTTMVLCGTRVENRVSGTIPCKFWGFKVQKEGKTVCNLVPAMKISDGTVGMYDIKRRKFLTNKGSGTFTAGPIVYKPLPKEYLELEYIKSTGTQYINTGINARTVSGFTIKGTCATDAEGRTNKQLLGGTDTTAATFFGARAVSGTWWYCCDNGTPMGNPTHLSEIDVTINGSGQNQQPGTLKDLEAGTTTSFTSFISTGTYWLLPDENLLVFGGDTNRRSPDASIYYLELRFANAAPHKFIPVQRLSDGSIGMYDLTARTFLPNAGTGTFITGSAIVNNIPREYIQVDYLQGDGNAYIDTDIKLTENHEIELKTQLVSNSNAMSIFGSRTTASNNNIAVLLHGSQNLSVDFNNSNYETYRLSTSALVDTYYNIIISKSYRQINSITSSTLCEDTILTPSNAYLFYISGSPISTNKYTGKIYEFYIKQNNSYLQVLVPVYDIINNEYCMYDLVTRTALRNVGTGAFTGGEIYPNYIGLNNVESIGEKYMNTGIIPNQNYSMELEFQPTLRRTQVFAGTRNVSPTSNGFHINNSNNNTQMISFDGQSVSLVDNVTTDKHKVYLTKDSATYDNRTVTFTSSDFQSTTPIFLFGCNSNDMLVLDSKVKIYHCKIWNGKTLVANYMPVIDTTTNKEGFLNKVDNSFITWGSGIDTIPADYLQQDYITFNGSSNYVDTEIVPTDVTNIEVNVRAKANVITSFNTVYGFMNTASTVTPRMGLHYYNNKYMIGINNTTNNGVTSDTNWHDFKLTNDNNNHELLYVDGTHDKTSSSNDNAFSTNDLSIYLGARHQHDNTVNYFNGQISYYSYQQNGTYIAKCYPVLRFSDNKNGFYDTVRKKFLPLH